ncbi:MAG: hypothetical protein WED34_16385 [Planctomycetales bacterium]
MVIRLTSEIEVALTGEAQRLGVPPERLALESLRDRFVAPRERELLPAAEEDSLADYLGAHLGVLHSSEHVPGGAALSQDRARKFLESLEARRRPDRP